MKFALNIQSGSLAGTTWELNGEFLTIGRGNNCNVRFEPLRDRMISTNHAYIENKPDGFYLVDNESTNGTFVNGEKITKTRLRNNDIIRFGKDGPEATVSITNEVADGQSEPTYQFQPPPPANSQPLNNQSINSQSVNNQQFQFPQFQSAAVQPPPPQNWRNSASSIGIGNPAITPAATSAGKYIGIAIAIFAIVFLSLIVTLIVVANLGIIPAFISAVVAFIPALFYILPLMFLDRYDPEPPWALALAFAWGALVAILFSAIVNDIFGAIFGHNLSGVISAPIFEEGSKGLGVVLFLLFLRKEFDDILDGIIYAGTIALGFATVENVLYYGRGLLEGGFGALIFLFVLRGILSPFAHVTFTSMTGIGCGISRESHNTAVRLIMPVIGYLAAVSLHALWNGMAFFGVDILHVLNVDWVCEYMGLSGQLEGICAFLLTYSILEVPLFLAFLIFSIYIMRRQNRILKEMLAIDVARGLITEDQLKTATSVFRSLSWLIGSAFTAKYRARRRFLRAVGKLGLSYWHIQRATAAQGHTASFQQNPILREEVLQWRDKV